MTDDRFPDLPSDEELGIDGLDDEASTAEVEEGAGSFNAPPPQPPAPRARPRTESRAGPRDRRAWIPAVLILALLLVGTWLSSADRSLPSPAPANAPDTAFSSARAMSHLVDLARAPRPVGAPEHTRARERVIGWLSELGLDPEVHEGVSMQRVGNGESVRAVTIRNVLARVPGTNPDSSEAILLTAHYDAVPLSHGAGDDGVGVVAILEALRAIQTGPPLANDLIVLITDAEELGLLGARAFVEEHPWMDDVRVVLSAEMRGGGGPVEMFETGAENGWIVRAMQASDPRPRATSLSVEVYRRLPNDTDFTPFREAGIQGLNFAGIDRDEIYHQPTDRPANIQESTIQHMGERLLAITRELGSRDLGSVNAPDLVYSTLPILGIVAYPEALALPISTGILLLWIAVAVLVVRGREDERRVPKWAGIPIGFLLVAIAGAVTIFAGWGLLRWLPRYHPEFGSLSPAFYGEGWYILALVAIAVAILLTLLGLTRRFVHPAPVAAGAVLPLVLGATGSAVLAPLAAMELQIPALAGTVAAAAVALFPSMVGSADKPSHPGSTPSLPLTGLLLLLTLPVLATMVPLIEVLWVAMSFRFVIGLSIVVVLALSALLPALLGLTAPNRWWAPLTALLLAGAMVGGGVLQAGPSADRPLPSTLLYAMDRESGEALWLTRDDPGFEWAEERAGPFGEFRTLDTYSLPGSYRTAPAPPNEIAEPRVELIRDEDQIGPSRTVQLHVVTTIGAELLTVELEGADSAAPPGALAAVNGQPLPLGTPGSVGARRDVTRLIHQGIPASQTADPAQPALLLEVEVTEGTERIHLRMLEEHLRPAEILGPGPFERPPHLMPSARGRSDRLLVRSRVTIELDPGPDM